MIRRRPQLLWLLVPYVLYLGVLPFVNRVTPLVFGVPFLFVWLLGATLLTPVAVWLTRRADLQDRNRNRDWNRGRNRDRDRHRGGRA
ncbi:DUF3311 domain-containing protein [Streptomyces anulatus]|uniref:DUF3311 domain-containing protein n=1 Tax=Streptomyces TaxID=1883 RepID=UPI00211D46CE|nr:MULTISPECIES: DUF3311 domain-containing protein [unclassified Streptomyces]WTF66756.1 DUF3311 domain-containing protein [Streptomyces anulatus]